MRLLVTIPTTGGTPKALQSLRAGVASAIDHARSEGTLTNDPQDDESDTPLELGAISVEPVSEVGSDAQSLLRSRAEDKLADLEGLARELLFHRRGESVQRGGIRDTDETRRILAEIEKRIG